MRPTLGTKSFPLIILSLENTEILPMKNLKATRYPDDLA